MAKQWVDILKAANHSYDNTASALTATDVKSAIDEVSSNSAGDPDNAKLSGSVFTGLVAYNDDSAGAATVDCSLGNSFTRVVTGDTTFNFTNIPTTGIIVLKLYDAGDFVITWSGATFKWIGGAAPTFTSNGDDIVVLYTNDGTTLYQSANIGYA